MLKTLSYSIVAMDIYLRPMVLSLPACLYVRAPYFIIIFHSLGVLLMYGYPSIILGYYLWFCIKYISDILYCVHKICCMTISFVPKLILEYLIVQIM